jgi:hypothetical protein
MARFITGIWSLFFLGVKIVHLVDRTYLCKINKLVYGDKEIVTNRYPLEIKIKGVLNTMIGFISLLDP